MAEAVRMTKGLAENIANIAVNKAFKERFEILVAKGQEIAMRGYQSIMTKDLIKKVEALPLELKYNKRQVELRIDGRLVRADFKDNTFLFPRGWDYIYYVKDDNTIKAWHMYETELEKTKLEKNDAFNRLNVLLQSCSNFNKVAELWPEGKEFYKDYMVPQTKSGLPAICFDDVNKALGLAKKGEKK